MFVKYVMHANDDSKRGQITKTTDPTVIKCVLKLYAGRVIEADCGLQDSTAH